MARRRGQGDKQKRAEAEERFWSMFSSWPTDTSHLITRAMRACHTGEGAVAIHKGELIALLAEREALRDALEPFTFPGTSKHLLRRDRLEADINTELVKAARLAYHNGAVK